MKINLNLNETRSIDGITILCTKIGGSWMKITEGDPIFAGVSPDSIVKITVARLNNPKYKSYVESETRKYRKIISKENDGGLLDRIIISAIARFIIRNWEGFTIDNEKGETVKFPYNKENAVLFMTVDPDFRAFIIEVASEEGTFFDDNSEDQRKNYLNVSSGS
jgi:hypothetical protein